MTEKGKSVEPAQARSKGYLSAIVVLFIARRVKGRESFAMFSIIHP